MRVNLMCTIACSLVAVAQCVSGGASAASKPTINSVTYSPCVGLRSGDVMTVELRGTPGGSGSFEIARYLPLTVMNESAPGVYWREVKLPHRGVTDACVIGHLAVGGTKAAGVQAGKLLTVRAQPEAVVARPSAPHTLSSPPVTARAAQIPRSVSRPSVVPSEPPVTVVKVVDTTVRPERPRDLKQILIKTPPDGATLKTAILVTGKASPGSRIAVSITYNNGLSGLMKLSGLVASQSVAVGRDGSFRVGPYALDGPLATKGLRFSVKAYYTDRPDHGTATVTAIGDRT